jgi:hypothetical protein
LQSEAPKSLSIETIAWLSPRQIHPPNFPGVKLDDHRPPPIERLSPSF